jgi:hypothetical protein
MTNADGTVINTTWVNGKKHGEGVIMTSDKEKIAVTYYEDFELKDEQGSSDCYSYFWISLSLSMLALMSLLGIIGEEKSKAIYVFGMIVFYSGMVVEMYFNSTYKYMNTV